jgi:protein-L-isoaspartate(D-aspartate) O-methyltransferase
MMTDFARLREMMVERQIAGRGVRDRDILRAFREVPREAFVPDAEPAEAYGDHPLPIAAGQTISQPYIVAATIEAARVRRGSRVLEIGAGSGYAAAIISRIAEQVVAIERHGELARLASERMRALGYDNVTIIEGDGSVGWPDGAPYDAIVAAAAGRHVPQVLVDQLAPGGCIVMPVGNPGGVQQMVRVTLRSDGSTTHEELARVRFVPLIGEEGWSDG